MTLFLLLLSGFLAFVGVDMLRLSTRHRRPATVEDKDRYGIIGANLTVEQRAQLELAADVSPFNLRPLIGLALAVSGFLGLAFAVYLLLIPE
jgi:hypothetical protein